MSAAPECAAKDNRNPLPPELWGGAATIDELTRASSAATRAEHGRTHIPAQCIRYGGGRRARNTGNRNSYVRYNDRGTQVPISMGDRDGAILCHTADICVEDGLSRHDPRNDGQHPRSPRGAQSIG